MVCDNKAKGYAVGIDLHGTLLNSKWEIERDHLCVLERQFGKLQETCNFYICTGNDLQFVEQFVPQEIRRHISGYILENGSVYSDGIKEELIVSEAKRKKIEDLARALAQAKFDDLLFSARRLATISLFTKKRDYGKSPEQLYHQVSRFVEEINLSELFLVTHSDVAVDIFSKENDKYTALDRMYPEVIKIAIADSYNDWGFLTRSKYSFMPANYSLHLAQRAREKGIDLLPIEKFANTSVKVIYYSNESYTAGLIEILNTIITNFGVYCEEDA